MHDGSFIFITDILSAHPRVAPAQSMAGCIDAFPIRRVALRCQARSLLTLHPPQNAHPSAACRQASPSPLRVTTPTASGPPPHFSFTKTQRLQLQQLHQQLGEIGADNSIHAMTVTMTMTGADQPSFISFDAFDAPSSPSPLSLFSPFETPRACSACRLRGQLHHGRWITVCRLCTLPSTPFNESATTITTTSTLPSNSTSSTTSRTISTSISSRTTPWCQSL